MLLEVSVYPQPKVPATDTKDRIVVHFYPASVSRPRDPGRGPHTTSTQVCRIPTPQPLTSPTPVTETRGEGVATEPGHPGNKQVPLTPLVSYPIRRKTVSGRGPIPTFIETYPDHTPRLEGRVGLTLCPILAGWVYKQKIDNSWSRTFCDTTLEPPTCPHGLKTRKRPAEGHTTPILTSSPEPPTPSSVRFLP